MRAVTGESRREHWRKLIMEQRASGINRRAFCEERGIKADTMYWWERRLNSTTGTNSLAVFKEVGVLSASKEAEYTIRLVNKRELIVKGSFIADRVRQLVELLEGSSDA